jgi:hypothetical protein
LREEREHHTVSVGRGGEQLADHAVPLCTLGSLSFALDLNVHVEDLSLDIPVVLGKVADLGEVGDGLLMFADLGQPARRLDSEEGEEEDDRGEVDVED